MVHRPATPGYSDDAAMSETLQEAFDEAGPWDMTQGELDVLYESRGEPESMEEQRKMLLAFEQHAFSSQ